MMKNQKQLDRDLSLFGDRPQNLLLQNFPVNVQQMISKFPKPIQLKDWSVVVYWPAQHVSQGDDLTKDITDLLEGATSDKHRLCRGLWNSPTGELAIDEIILIESFTDINGIINHLPTLLERVSYWGGVCKEECVALKICSMMGSCMLLIPTA